MFSVCCIGILIAIDFDESKANSRSDLVAVAPHVLKRGIVRWIQIVLHTVDELMEVVEPNWKFGEDVFQCDENRIIGVLSPGCLGQHLPVIEQPSQLKSVVRLWVRCLGLLVD